MCISNLEDTFYNWQLCTGCIKTTKCTPIIDNKACPYDLTTTIDCACLQAKRTQHYLTVCRTPNNNNWIMSHNEFLAVHSKSIYICQLVTHSNQYVPMNGLWTSDSSTSLVVTTTDFNLDMLWHINHHRQYNKIDVLCGYIHCIGNTLQ